MVFVTLEQIKAWLRYDDITSDDERLEQLGNAAEGLALRKINRTADEVVEMEDSDKAMFILLVKEICESTDSEHGIHSGVQLYVTPAAQAIACALRKLEV